MNRIVLDTNVLVSGMINAHGAPGRIVDLVREEQVELALSAAVPLVTDNADHYPASLRHAIDVLTPADYLKEAEQAAWG